MRRLQGLAVACRFLLRFFSKAMRPLTEGLPGVGEGVGASLAMEMGVGRLDKDLVLEPFLGGAGPLSPRGSGGLGAGGPSSMLGTAQDLRG